MKARKLIIPLLLAPMFFTAGRSFAASVAPAPNDQDTLVANQILYNGRWWRNLQYMVKGDQFLFSTDFIPGSVTISGLTFTVPHLRYDIYSDELMIPGSRGAIVQLNKELVDSFTLSWKGRDYHFRGMNGDSTEAPGGYVNVLYGGKTAVVVKYKKEIELLAVDRRFDLFYQTHKVYMLRDNIAYTLSGKRDLLRLLSHRKQELREFIRKNRISLSKSNPDSFVPVLRFYDNLNLTEAAK